MTDKMKEKKGSLRNCRGSFFVAQHLKEAADSGIGRRISPSYYKKHLVLYHFHSIKFSIKKLNSHLWYVMVATVCVKTQKLERADWYASIKNIAESVG
jgi:hypothetical protein